MVKLLRMVWCTSSPILPASVTDVIHDKLESVAKNYYIHSAVRRILTARKDAKEVMCNQCGMVFRVRNYFSMQECMQVNMNSYSYIIFLDWWVKLSSGLQCSSQASWAGHCQGFWQQMWRMWRTIPQHDGPYKPQTSHSPDRLCPVPKMLEGSNPREAGRAYYYLARVQLHLWAVWSKLPVSDRS